jgi:type VI secretion system Hcp family effector
MKNLPVLLVALVGLFLCENVPAPVYMKYDDIKGEASESKDQGHKEWIDILSWSGGTPAKESGRGLATGKRTHEPLVITKKVDKASPLLARAQAEGTVYPVIEFAVEQRKCTLTNAKIVSVKTEKTMETISFNYEEIKWQDEPAGRKPVPKRAVPAPTAK